MKPIKVRSFASRLRGVKVKANIAKGDALCDALVAQVAHFLPGAQREARFHDERMWRFDICWHRQRGDPTCACPWIAVEVEGGGWVAGAHSRGAHFESDLVKYAEACALGWIVLRVSPQMVRDGRAAAWLRRIAERP